MEPMKKKKKVAIIAAKEKVVSAALLYILFHLIFGIVFWVFDGKNWVRV